MYWTLCDVSSVSNSALQHTYDTLTPSRKVHIDRLRRREDQVRSLAAEVLVQQLLQTHFHITDAALCRGDSGQPYLTGCDLFVSISHSDQKVACAVSQTPVGIDIEKIRPVDLNLCRHVCVEEEKQYVLGDLPQWPAGLCRDTEILQRFFEVWTAKEAYFKKLGTGITDLKSVNILPMERHIPVLDDYILQYMK